METPSRKGPPPWLAPVVAILSLTLFIGWAYIQIQHWKEPEADYMAIAANICITVALWGFLVWGIIQLRRLHGVGAVLPGWFYPSLGLPILIVGLLLVYILSGRPSHAAQPPPSPGATRSDVTSVIEPLRQAIEELPNKIHITVAPQPRVAVAATPVATPLQVTPDNIGTFIAQWTDNLHMLRQNQSDDQSFPSFIIVMVNARVVVSRIRAASNYLLFQVRMERNAEEQALFNGFSAEESATMLRELDTEAARRQDTSFSRTVTPFVMVLERREPITSSLSEATFRRSVGDLDSLTLLLHQIAQDALSRHRRLK